MKIIFEIVRMTFERSGMTFELVKMTFQFVKIIFDLVKMNFSARHFAIFAAKMISQSPLIICDSRFTVF